MSPAPNLSSIRRKPYDRFRARRITQSNFPKCRGRQLMAASLLIRPPRVVIAPDWSIADAAGLALATGLAAVKHYESDAVSGEIESVHQMRVSVRRLRA